MRSSDLQAAGRGFSPRGITVLAWLVIIGAALTLLLELILSTVFGVRHGTEHLPTTNGWQFVRQVVAPSLVFVRYTALAAGVAAIGMLPRWDWARRLMLVVLGAWTAAGAGVVLLFLVGLLAHEGDELRKDPIMTVILIAPFAILAIISFLLFRSLRGERTLASFREHRRPAP